MRNPFASDARRRLLLIGGAVALVLVLANAAVAIAIAARGHHQATAWPDETFRFWPERSWGDIEREIAGLPGSRRLAPTVLGTVSYRGDSYPLHLLSFGVTGGPPRARVLLVGSIHGTEPAGGRALLDLAGDLAGDPSLLAEAAIDIVPIANPWGWVHGYRYTGNGEDINRDFASRRTQEAELLRGLLRARGPYDLVLDLHESKKSGSFVYQYLPAAEGFGAVFARLVQAAGEPLEERYREWFWRVEAGVLRIPALALRWVALARQLSLEHYARLHGTRHAYTVETPVADAFGDRVLIHRRAAIAFIRALAAASEEPRAGR